MTGYDHYTMFPLGSDETTYRKLDIYGGMGMTSMNGEEILTIDPAVIAKLSAEAFKDINHLLRPAHLVQLSKILEDPEASNHDRFVALDLLKNANIAAGGCCLCARIRAPPSSWGRRVSGFGPAAATKRPWPKAPCEPMKRTTCVIPRWRP